MAKTIVGTGRAQGMRIEQIVAEGDYEKGRLVGIAGHWEDGAALMWNTEMARLGLTPFDDPQWNKLSDSHGMQLRGTQKSIVGGIWMKWKQRAESIGSSLNKLENVGPVQTPAQASSFRNTMTSIVSAAGKAAMNHISALAEADLNRAANERADDGVKRDRQKKAAVKSDVENKNLPTQEQAKQGAAQGKEVLAGVDHASDPLYKSKLCKNFSTDGSCKFGDKCVFAHGQADLRPDKFKSVQTKTESSTRPGINSTGESAAGKVEVFICASCPKNYQDEVSHVCRNLGIQKAYGRPGDMVDSLSGKDWVGKWEAKVVMATVTKAHTLKARKARIICISGGPHCDLEIAQQPRIVRAIKQEMSDEDFIVKVEWIEIRQFREDYAAGYSGVSITADGGSKPGTEKSKHEGKSRPGSASLGDAKGKQPRCEAGSKQPPTPIDPKGRSPASAAGGEKQQVKDGQGKHTPTPQKSAKEAGAAGGAVGSKGDGTIRPAAADGRSRKAGGDAESRPPGRAKRPPGAEVGKDRGPGRAWVCKQCRKEFDHRRALLQHQGGTGHAGVSRAAAADAATSNKESPAPAVWVCGECERQFTSEAACDQHQTATGHSDPTCGCGRSFGSRGALRQHMDATGHDPVSSSEDSDEDFDWVESDGPAADQLQAKPSPPWGGREDARRDAQAASSHCVVASGAGAVDGGSGSSAAVAVAAATALAMAAAAGYALYNLSRGEEEEEEKKKPRAFGK